MRTVILFTVFYLCSLIQWYCSLYICVKYELLLMFCTQYSKIFKFFCVLVILFIGYIVLVFDNLLFYLFSLIQWYSSLYICVKYEVCDVLHTKFKNICHRKKTYDLCWLKKKIVIVFSSHATILWYVHNWKQYNSGSMLIMWYCVVQCLSQVLILAMLILFTYVKVKWILKMWILDLFVMGAIVILFTAKNFWDLFCVYVLLVT